MKKTLAIILTVSILLCSISVAAYAAAAVFRIGLTIESDISGLTLADYEEFIEIEFGEVDFYCKNSPYPITATPVDGTAFEGTFTAGETYKISVCLAAENAGYYIPPYLSSGVSIMGENAKLTGYTITIVEYGTNYVTIDTELTVDELDFFEKIAKAFSDLFARIEEFFAEVFSFGK